MTIYEKYRPRTLDGVIGQESLVNRLRVMMQSGFLLGNTLLVTGRSGTGKTTLVRALAEEYTDITFGFREYNAQELTLDEVKDKINFFATYSWSGKPHHLIVNEVHNFNYHVKKYLLVALEKLGERNNTVVMFTSILPGEARRDTELLWNDDTDRGAILSRVIELKLNTQGTAQAFAERAQEIARLEGLDGKPISAYLRLVNDLACNFRQVLQKISAGVMMGNEE